MEIEPMGDIVALPTRANLDRLGRYAALTIMAVELARVAMHEADDTGAMEITLNSEHQALTRAGMLALAEDMLAQREAIVSAMGQRAGAELVERVARAFARMQQAKAMYRASEGRTPDQAP